MKYVSELVSVIMPFYNGNEYINEALQSAVEQSYKFVEVIVIVDKGSEEPIFNRNLKNVKVIYNVGSERGPGVCRHIGIEEAQGRYLAFLDSDDVWLPEKLKKQINIMKQNQYAFSFTSYVDFTLNKEMPVLLTNNCYNIENFLIKKFTVGNSTVVLDRNFIGSIRKPTLARRNDYQMWYYILKKLSSNQVKWGGIKEILCYRRLHDDNLTKNKFISLYFTYKLYYDFFDNRAKAMIYFIRSSAYTSLRIIKQKFSRSTAIRKQIERT